MIERLQLGLCLAAAITCFSLPLASMSAQNPRSERPPQHQQSPSANSNRPSAPANQNANRPPARPQNPPNQNYSGHANRPPANAGRPNTFENNRPNYSSPNNGARLTPRQQIGIGAARPFVDKMREMTPQQRERQLQSSRVFQNLAPDKQNRIRNQFNQWDRMSPQQRADLRDKERVWRDLSAEQKQHIKNDVLPQWRSMPWTRQQVMQQKLGVLQNMPESARNRRLNDPNFTNGMSDQEKSMLHDLAHMHVGGAPDPPGNE